jgi:hypothetical protein
MILPSMALPKILESPGWKNKAPAGRRGNKEKSPEQDL